VTLVFLILGLAGWGLARQMNHLAADLPGYRVNILAKIEDVRGAGTGGSVEKLQQTIEDIKTDPRKIRCAQRDGLASRRGDPGTRHGVSVFIWLGPIVRPLGTARLVLASGDPARRVPRTTSVDAASAARITRSLRAAWSCRRPAFRMGAR
jgi:hypothetical protein